VKKSAKTFPEESRDCTGAIDNLYHLCDEMDAATDKVFSPERGKLVSKLDKAKLMLLRTRESRHYWEAIERLLLRPWWRRVWTLQEFLVSDRLLFYCGRRSISRGTLEKAIFGIWACKGWAGDIMSRKAFYGAWNRRRMNEWYEKQKHEMGLIASLADVGDCGATDARDRIYSLRGVAKDMISSLDPKSTLEEVSPCTPIRNTQNKRISRPLLHYYN
jgi:hypothetical protein